jgi:hypothetical protein
MATLKEITHDSSTTLSDFYSSITDPDGAVTVTAAAALGGSTNGLNIDNDAGAGAINLADTFLSATPSEARFRVRVDLGGLTNNNSSSLIASIAANSSNPAPDLRLDIEINGDGTNGFEVTGYANQDAVPTLRSIGPVAMPSSGEVCIELSGSRETADGNNDGTLELFVDGVSQGSLFDFDIIEPKFRSPALISGTYKADEFILIDVLSTDLCAGALGLAAMTKPADIDAAGTFIYVALLSGGTPILTKISTDLDADGTTVFDPGAGDNIGIECGRFSSDTIWVAGNFDGTNVIEKSEDAGSTFTVKDDATIGDVRSFVMGPDSDERILIFDETNGDILETNDDGSSWDSINASVTPEVNAIARLGRNVQESVFGNDGGVSDSINYSVNSGDDLEDFQTGVYPNANATKVVVN